MIRAITICQPYAELIMLGCKTVENRKWPLKPGPIVIHAGKSKTWWKTYRNEDGPINREQVPYGCVVGVANVIGCAKIDDDWGQFENHRNHHASGPVCWLLSEVRRVAEVFPATGKQGLWNLQPFHWQTQLMLEPTATEAGAFTIASYFEKFKPSDPKQNPLRKG